MDGSAAASRRDSDVVDFERLQAARGQETPYRSVPALMVVGTPRSGTTLLQRAIAEQGAFATIPETHVFTVFAPRVLRTVRFPLEGDDLRSVLGAYASLPQHRGGAPSATSVFDRLGGRASSLVDVFRAVVIEMSDGADLVVEKTPDHLLWVTHLAPLLPSTKFVAVVRDPRAVIASTRQVHWGQQNPVMAAERWARDQRLLLRARTTLGDDRLLIVAYEALVADPTEVVDRIERFVGLDQAIASSDPATNRGDGVRLDQVFRDHEMEWKGRVGQPITADRVDAWRSVLTAHEVAGIERICRKEMSTLGYRGGDERRLGLGEHADRLRYATRRTLHELRIRHRHVVRAGMSGSS